MIGSKVTAILLEGWILPVIGVALKLQACFSSVNHVLKFLEEEEDHHMFEWPTSLQKFANPKFLLYIYIHSY